MSGWVCCANPRTAAGYRLYDATDLERVNFIRSAQELGFTLEQARQLLALRASDTAHAQAVLDITLAKIADAEAGSSACRISATCCGCSPTNARAKCPSPLPILAFLTARRKDQQHNKKHQAAQDERSSLAKGLFVMKKMRLIAVLTPALLLGACVTTRPTSAQVEFAGRWRAIWVPDRRMIMAR
jgi:MerR family Zn(II)-responsive transcriptional regulator of zntA